jgi:uncharacterized protein (TIGR02118 family)
MIKRIGLIRRKSALTQEQFESYWLNTHAALARKLPGLQRYCVNLLERERFAELGFDGFSELWFESEAALNAALASPEGVMLLADLPNFTEKIYPVVVTEHRIVWPS